MNGERLRELRKKHGLTQTQLGKLINLSHVSISGYENNTRLPDAEILSKLADVLNTTTDYLLGRTNNPKKDTTKTTDAQFLFFEKENLTSEDEDYLKLMVETMKKRNKGV
ncbi:helix-turn-helix domain-containing protein [Carnobacterium maltaromaticum]|uniref:helix-turn-helix domain-containing protein n=1 Tax=Carnobacterium maltaromaticum TaxID=2751 RepID=UPI0039BDD742